MVERANRVVIETIRAMLYAGGLLLELWAEVSRAAVLLRNALPARCLRVTPQMLL